MTGQDALRVLTWLCAEGDGEALLRDSHVMQALGLSEAAAQTALAQLKADGLIESQRVFTQGLQGYRCSVWGIRPTEAGRQVAQERPRRAGPPARN